MKKIVILIGLVIIGSLVVYTIYNGNEDTASTPVIENVPDYTEEKVIILDQSLNYEALNNEVLNAGPPKDGIPPIDDPVYMSLEDALTAYDHDEPMFIYESNEGIYLYPQSILVWHEIVNDTIDGESVAITYCPLTGSAICYANLDNNTFGTSGSLLNSNLVMYDRLTESYIPQILGIGISEDLQGTVLNTRPVYWTSLNEVKDVYDKIQVLSTETGFFRDYTRDPYGSYEPIAEDNYYNSGEPFFPLMFDHKGDFQSKYSVVGIKHQSTTIALDPLLVKENGLYEFEIGGLKAVAFYDSRISAVRVFNREEYSFTFNNDQIIDQDGNKWSANAVSEHGSLKPITHFDVMWFAWYAFYPDTEVIK
jgi:hypothetical protein